MAEGVTTRLQKEFNQLQKDVERRDAVLEENFEKLGNMLRNDLFVELKHSLEHIHAEISSIKHALPGAGDVLQGNKNPEIVEMDFGGSLPKQGSHTTVLGNFSRVNAPFIQELNSHTSLGDIVRIIPHRSKLDCPRFDGYDFLGWHMKMEQYFDAVGTQEVDKIQLVMIHLDGRALQWHQRLMRTKGSLKEMKWENYLEDV